MGNKEIAERNTLGKVESVEQRRKLPPILKGLCYDCIKLILLFVVRTSSDVIKFQTLNRNFFAIVLKNHWITNNVIYKLYRYPQKPQTQVTQLFYSSSNFRKFDSESTVSSKLLLKKFPNLVELTLYSNSRYRKGVNIQVSALRDLRLKYLRISQGILENDLVFPISLKSLILISRVENLLYKPLSTIPTNLSELVLSDLRDFPDREALQSLSFLTNNGIQHHLERLTIRNCPFHLTVYEDDIPLFSRLRHLNIGLCSTEFGRDSFVLVETVEKLKGSKWGELKDLEHLCIEGGSSARSNKFIQDGKEIARYSSTVFETPFEFEKFPSFFPNLRTLEITNILHVELVDIQKFERLKKVRVLGQFGRVESIKNGSTMHWINKQNESCTLEKN